METKTISSQCLEISTLFLITFILLASNIQKSLAISTTKTSESYLKTSCNCTAYPQLCYSTLSTYISTIQTNDLKLCNVAVAITLQAAKNTSSIVKSLSKKKGLSKTEASVVKDCLDEIGDTITSLNKSLKALRKLNVGSSNLKFQVQNIRTWVSAAITDEGTCTDEFEVMKVSAKLKNLIKENVVSVNRFTAIALALITHKLSY